MPSKRTTADFSQLSGVAIAQLMGVDVRTVTRWCGQGAPRNDDGSFDAPAVVQWRISRAAAKGETDQRQRLAAAQAERVERENLIAAGELIRTQDAIAAWQTILLDARTAFLNLGHRLAPLLANVSAGTACKIVDDRVREILTDLAEAGSENSANNLQK
jgi:hypothetical protein